MAAGPAVGLGASSKGFDAVCLPKYAFCDVARPAEVQLLKVASGYIFDLGCGASF